LHATKNGRVRGSVSDDSKYVTQDDDMMGGGGGVGAGGYGSSSGMERGEGNVRK